MRIVFALALAGVLAAPGCAHHAVDIDVTPPIVPPAVPQQSLAIVPLNERAAAPMLSGGFHDDLKAAIRRTQVYQVIDYSGPWPVAASRPLPGEAIDLRRLVADVQKTCPSAFTLLYEVTQITTVKPLKLGVRVMLLRTADGVVVLDYDGVWDAPAGPPPPIPREGWLGWLLPPIIPPHDPISEISPRSLGQTASRDIALMLTNPASPAGVMTASGPAGPPANDPQEWPEWSTSVPAGPPAQSMMFEPPTAPPPLAAPPAPGIPELGVIE